MAVAKGHRLSLIVFTLMLLLHVLPYTNFKFGAAQLQDFPRQQQRAASSTLAANSATGRGKYSHIVSGEFERVIGHTYF